MVADPRTGAISIAVDGKSWTMLCDFNALCDFAVATGEDALAFIQSLEGSKSEPDILKVRQLIHCMLLQTHDDATLKDAGRVLTVAPLAMMDAIVAGTPDAANSDKPEEATPEGEERAAQS
jgi:hypothetical protein